MKKVVARLFLVSTLSLFLAPLSVFAQTGGSNSPGCYCDVNGTISLLTPPPGPSDCIQGVSMEWPVGSGTMVNNCVWYANGLPATPAEAAAQGEGAVTQSKVNQIAGKLRGLNKITGLSGSSTSSVSVLLGRGVKFMLSFIGSIGLLMFVYAGITMMSAGGNKDKMMKATKIMVWSGLGLAAAVGSYGIVQWIFDAF